MDEITTKWNKTGLLDDLDSELDKTLLSNNLEDGVKVLLEIHKDPQKELKAGLFLPIIVRLFMNGIRVIDDMDILYKKFDDFFKNGFDSFKQVARIHNIDAEAEFCSMFVENMKS